MERHDTNLRKCIPLGKRIAIAVYKLSSSAEYRTVANLFGVGKSSVCEIVNEFCYFVAENLMQDFTQFPISEESAKNCILGLHFLNSFNIMTI